MDRLQYNILLEETGIYNKKVISKEEIDSCDGDFLYKDQSTDKLYEIIPNDMSNDEIKIALLARQTKHLDSLHKTADYISILIALIIIIFVLVFCAIIL